MAEQAVGSASLFSNVVLEIVYSPLNLLLLGICIFLLYRIFVLRQDTKPSRPREPEMPRMKKRDFTLEQLKEYNGLGPDKRILIGVNGKVFDVSKGKRFYGPGGPYEAFAGRDASRAFATFSVENFKDEYDDLSDLNSMQMESVKEWELQLSEKYAFVGRLLKPGEDPQEYSDEEDSASPESKAEDDKKK